MHRDKGGVIYGSYVQRRIHFLGQLWSRMPGRSEAAYAAIGPRLTGQVGSTEWRVNIGMRLSVYSTDALAD